MKTQHIQQLKDENEFRLSFDTRSSTATLMGYDKGSLTTYPHCSLSGYEVLLLLGINGIAGDRIVDALPIVLFHPLPFKNDIEQLDADNIRSIIDNTTKWKGLPPSFREKQFYDKFVSESRTFRAFRPQFMPLVIPMSKRFYLHSTKKQLLVDNGISLAFTSENERHLADLFLMWCDVVDDRGDRVENFIMPVFITENDNYPIFYNANVPISDVNTLKLFNRGISELDRIKVVDTDGNEHKLKGNYLGNTEACNHLGKDTNCVNILLSNIDSLLDEDENYIGDKILFDPNTEFLSDKKARALSPHCAKSGFNCQSSTSYPSILISRNEMIKKYCEKSTVRFSSKYEFEFGHVKWANPRIQIAKIERVVFGEESLLVYEI